MEPRIIFLGTAGDCMVTGKQLRASGGIVLQLGKFQFFIDPGPGALNTARTHAVNIRNTTALLATHNHVNHANDVNAVIDAMTHGGLDVQGIFIGNKTVIEGEDIHKPILSEVHRNYVDRLIMLRPGQKVAVENIEIKALKAYHSDPNTIGLRFTMPKLCISYSSDTRYVMDLLDEYAKSQVLILNVTYPFRKDDKTYDQLCADDAVEILEQVKPEICIITHFGKKMLDEDPVFIAREIQKRSGVHVLAARDGLIVNPLSHL